MKIKYEKYLAWWDWKAWFEQSRWTEKEGWTQKKPIRSDYPDWMSEEEWNGCREEAKSFCELKGTLVENSD